MSQVVEPSLPDDPDAPKMKPTVSWEEISPESLRTSAESMVTKRGSDSDDALGGVGMAWFEVILGILFGLVMAVGAWYWSDGALGIIVAMPPIVFGLPLMLTKRIDLKYIGYGLLVSVPIAVVLGVLLWYLTLFI